MKIFFPLIFAVLLSCSNFDNKLQGRWEQSSQYSTSGELKAGLVKDENDFRYWEFDGDTLEIDGERVPYELANKDLTVKIDGNLTHLEVTKVTKNALHIATKRKLDMPSKYYTFKK